MGNKKPRGVKIGRGGFIGNQFSNREKEEETSQTSSITNGSVSYPPMSLFTPDFGYLWGEEEKSLVDEKDQNEMEEEEEEVDWRKKFHQLSNEMVDGGETNNDHDNDNEKGGSVFDDERWKSLEGRVRSFHTKLSHLDYLLGNSPSDWLDEMVDEMR